MKIFLRKYKYIILAIIFIFLGYFVRSYLSVDFPAKGNNHGLFFLNRISNNDFSFLKIIKDMINDQYMNYGRSIKYIYGFIVNFLGLRAEDVFIFQAILNIFSALFFGLFIYFIFNNKYSFWFIYILLLFLPHQIRFSFTENYHIFGNFFLSLSLLLFVISIKKISFGLLIISLFSFVISIYTRNEYLYFLFIYILIILYYYQKNDFKNNIKKLLNYKGIFIISLFILFITHRLYVLYTLGDHYSGETGAPLLLFISSIFDINKYNNFILNLPSVPVSIIYLIIFFTILGLFLKNNKDKLFLFIYIFFIYILYSIYKVYTIQFNFKWFEEFSISLIPHIIIIGGISIGLIIKEFRYKNYIKYIYYLIIVSFLFLPFIYKNEIQYLYSPQMEYQLIKQNIYLLPNNSNLILQGNGDKYVFAMFPEFMLMGKGININYLGGSMGEIIDESKLSYKNDYIFIGYDCYRYNDSSTNLGIRRECGDFIEKYNLETLFEKEIPIRAYMLESGSKYKKIKIGIYKIIGKKG